MGLLRHVGSRTMLSAADKRERQQQGAEADTAP